MHGARDEFLTRTRFAGDQDGGVRLAESADGAKDFLHRRRLAEDLGRQSGFALRTNLVHTLADRAPYQFDRLIDVEGFRQVFEGAALKSGDRAVQVGIGGHDDHRQRGKALAEDLQQFEPGLAGHADVGNKDLRRAAGVELGQRFTRGGEAAEGDLLARERFFEDPAN